MIRSTSLEAYELIRAKLSHRHERIAHVLFFFGPATANEASVEISKLATVIQPHELKNTHARFTELAALGVIAEVDRRACKVTGRTAIVWGLTGRKPTKAPVVTKAQQIEQLRAMISVRDARIRSLERQLQGHQQGTLPGLSGGDPFAGTPQ